MRKRSIFFLSILIALPLFSQEKAFKIFLADSALKNASVSFLVADADSFTTLYEYNSGKSLIPASVMKLVTTATALELLGPDYTFITTVGYTREVDKRTGILNGDIVIKGGGDPALGSENFEEHYGDFTGRWIEEIKKTGISKIRGKIITDDSYYDYQPVPGKWLWEDAGNYYGAGAYGLSLYDILPHYLARN